ncbi:hypothetical protein [Arthrobacter bambusae]|uniref:Fibronectin type-III domain-containing protein n=1 Tax=Arthrobacter bambusae TaxID=1338426 RepID=A0AAW8DBB5_9MICC|nr:hypothetical protein [Arthrobacter bambusae]MDP9905647.1 hypothetical protein [Arthrobacter bambusae]MDQ0127271.1 hypothetical protein [Arthrobacter bambusae]MDQ0178613.1 hypothetical protein [Arthrobacter bambusae]
MTDKKYEARLRALTAWALDVSNRGFVPPPPADLEAIARAKGTNADLVNGAVAEAWSAAIKALLTQVAFNIADPHLQLGEEFNEPTTDAGRTTELKSSTPAQPVAISNHAAGTTATSKQNSSPAPTVDRPTDDSANDADPAEQSYLALKKWRDGLVSNGAIFTSTIKDTQLRNVANIYANGHGDIRQSLTTQLKKFADQMETVLEGLNNDRAEIAPLPTGHDTALTPSVNVGGTQTPPSAPESVGPPPIQPPATDEAAATSASDAEYSTASPPNSVERLGMAFAAMDYSKTGDEPVQISFRTDETGRTLSWAEPSDSHAFKIYRLVSGDGSRPYNPDNADLVAVTRGLQASDERPFTHAVRYYQVWLNEGSTETLALASQPVLYAQGNCVGELSNVEVREDEGRVIGKWTALPGTQRVQIFRIPQERPANPASDPAYRILTGMDNLGGFVDAEAERGGAFIYKICAEGVVDNMTVLSAPASVPLQVSAVLAPVRDLRVDTTDSNGTVQFDLSWTSPPGGEVVIYRTQAAPVAGLDLKPLPEGSIRDGISGPEARLSYQVRLEDTMNVMKGIALPKGWTRAYFTPVTVLGNLVHVGTTVVKSVALQVKNPKVLERVNSQILTFEWPEGAGAVMVYQGPSGHDPELALSGQPVEVSEPVYRQRGGLHFETQLPAIGCDLHLVPVTFEAGKRVSGEPTTVNYPWIMRMKYELIAKKSMFIKTAGVSVVVTALERPGSPLSFVLVFNPDRLPLTISDGRPMNMIRDADGAPRSSRIFTPEIGTPNEPATAWRTTGEDWAADVGTQSGFLRLFASLPPEGLRRVALMDPPMDSLRVKGSSNVMKEFFGVK